MSDENRITRRRFLKRAAAAAAFAGGGAAIIPASALGGNGRASPGGRVAMGFIGVGGMGSGHLRGNLGHPGVQVMAVCDVDSRRRESARASVDAAYAEKRRSGAYKGCGAYNDFRELLARDDIDAVLIATPDHWHGLLTIAAAKAGKDVYCEKPLSLTVADGKAMVAAVRRYARVLQIGSQERSNRNCRYACELVRNGRLGELRTVYVGLPAGRTGPGPQPPMKVPDGFDYDMWLGPAPWMPYTRKRTHFSFRYILDYSGGELTDRGCHVIDLARWGAEPLMSGPVEIEGKGRFFTGGLYNTAFEYRIEFAYAGGLKMIVSSERSRGVRFVGDDGWIEIAIHGGALTASDPALLKSVIGPEEIHLHESPGHRDDFLRAVRTRGPVVAPVTEGHRSATLCHLCTIALRLGRRLTWDPAEETIVGDEVAGRLLDRPKRAPWHL